MTNMDLLPLRVVCILLIFHLITELNGQINWTLSIRLGLMFGC